MLPCSTSPAQSKKPRQQLSKAMEHMRFAVVVDAAPHGPPRPPETAASPATLGSMRADSDGAESAEGSDAYGVPLSMPVPRRAAPSDPVPLSDNAQQRASPFLFGTRLLTESSDILAFNAWDHVEPSAEYAAFSETRYALQREAPVSDFDRRRFNAHPDRWWDRFYKNNGGRFFKDRRWLVHEFPVLDELRSEGAPPALVLEVGAGAGNSAFPIVQENRNPRLKVHACDFSRHAVELVRANEAYDPRHIQADVWDVTAAPDADTDGEDASLPPGICPNSVDVVLMIFVFSALAPAQWRRAVANIWRVLKPGGQVLFRDYGRGDLAQLRFKKGRWMEENFYVRGDGTRVYFFEQEELEGIWGGREEGDGCREADSPAASPDHVSSDKEPTAHHSAPCSTSSSIPHSPAAMATANNSTGCFSDPNPIGADPVRPAFETIHFGVDRRMLVNRQRRLKMYRCWMQAVFRKPGGESAVPVRSIQSVAQPEEEAEQRLAGDNSFLNA